MPSSGMWLRTGLVWTDVSEERVASIFRGNRIRKLGTRIAATSSLLEFLRTVVQTAVKTSKLT
jgi:hypothetical protein